MAGSGPPSEDGTGTTGGSGGSSTPVTGVAEQTAVVQLRPTSFQISLHFMGEDRIAHEAATYRCKYQVLEEDDVFIVGSAPPPTTGPRITTTPSPAEAGEDVTITYDPAGTGLAGKPQVNLHYGFNNWATTVNPDVAMTAVPGTGWRATVRVPPDASQIDFVFTDGGTVWDNNNFQDWHLGVRGGMPARANPGTRVLVLTVPVENVHGYLPTPTTPPGTDPPSTLPMAAGGDNSRPDRDIAYRIQILDNHACSQADLNAVFGGGLAKPASYTTSQWMPAIKPAVPFRVVVKKMIGTQGVDFDQVDLTETLELHVEVKDPKEEFDQTDRQRRRFDEGFFHKYNGAAGNTDTTGDDNATTTFQGKRVTGDSPGVDAANLIRLMPYNNTPIAVEGVAGANSVQFNQLTVPGMDGKVAKVPVEIKDGPVPTGSTTGFKIGVADFAFLPSSTSGDNYRFLLHLKGGVGDAPDATKDVREQRANGARVKLYDEVFMEIPGPRRYTTGRFVVWRKVEFRMLVRCNGVVGNGDIDWPTVVDTYRRSFVEIVPPPLTYDITWQEWRDALATLYNPGKSHSWFKAVNDAEVQTAFPTGIIPGTATGGAANAAGLPFRMPGPRGTRTYRYNDATHVPRISRELTRIACAAQAPAMVNPSGDNQRSDPNGLYIVIGVGATPDPTYNTLGEYIGDRIFYMFPTNPSNIPDTTYTAAHELGHALYLSHSSTNARSAAYLPNGGALGNLMLVHPDWNNAAGDHDHRDAVTCLMGYTAGDFLRLYPYHPCGACQLFVRFYDKTAVQNTANYGNEMMQDLGPARFVCLNTTPNPDQLEDAIPNVAVGSNIFVMVLSKEKDWPQTGGTTWKAATTMTDLNTIAAAGVAPVAVGDPPAGAVTLNQTFNWTLRNVRYRVVQVTGTTAGRVRLTYSHNGVTAQTDVTVT